MKVILISGKMRSGKNQFAEYAIDYLNKKKNSVVQDSFASELKDRCKKDFSKLTKHINNIVKDLDFIKWNKGEVIKSLYTKDENWYEEKTPLTRLLLQIYGTEIFRDRVSKNYWIEILADKIYNLNSDYVFVTDCRFPNEIDHFRDYIRKLQKEKQDDKIIRIYTVRVNRDFKINQNKEHESEIALDDYKDWNYEINNNKDLKNLQFLTNEIITEIEEN